jgi:hypothetical protein
VCSVPSDETARRPRIKGSFAKVGLSGVTSVRIAAVIDMESPDLLLWIGFRGVLELGCGKNKCILSNL